METLAGKYNTVTCIDVMIHYPTDKVRVCTHRYSEEASFGSVICIVTARHVMIRISVWYITF